VQNGRRKSISSGDLLKNLIHA